jgi:hypothetical protein
LAGIAGLWASFPALADTILPGEEVIRGGGGCGIMAEVPMDGLSEEEKNVVSDTAVEIVFRRCLLEGLTLTFGQQARMEVLVEDLARGVGAVLGDDAATAAQYETFVRNADPLLDDTQLSIVQGHVDAALGPAPVQP